MNMPKMINADGKYEYRMKDLYYHIHVGNMAHRCQSRNQFRGLFLRCRTDGAELVGIERTLDLEDTASILDAVSDIATEQKTERVKAIADSGMLTSEEAEHMQNDENLTVAQKYALAKYNLVDFYHVDPDKITPKFVEEFGDAKVKSIYRNYRSIGVYREESIETAVNKWRENREQKDTSIADLHSSQSTLKCMFAVDILNGLLSHDKKYCENIGEFHEYFVARSTLEYNIDAVIADLRKHADIVSLLFEIRRDRLLRPCSTFWYCTCKSRKKGRSESFQGQTMQII
eukprot:TRINITY_DN764_c0_g2_i6.p1 TRINITY_DN764_c0_g2~~TRINITY_DN764_c0_g2_i6.p1  ORF type:complete len:287 (-),score=35.79 TRINITY_DN764_c0_g2_i6:232-1092(-)